MLNLATLTALHPELRDRDPYALADVTYDRLYKGRYEKDAFVNQFVSSTGPTQFRDIVDLHPELGDRDPDGIFDVWMRAQGRDPAQDDPKGVQRALFKGEEETRSWGEAVTDTGKGLLAGGLRAGAGAAWLLGAGDKADKLVDASERMSERKSDSLTQEQALAGMARDERVIEGDNPLSRGLQAASDYLTNPSLIGDTMAESAAYLIPGGAFAKGGQLIGRGAAVARGLEGARAASYAARGSQAGVVASSGLLEGADAALTVKGEVRDQIARLTDDELQAQSPRYRELRSGPNAMSASMAREKLVSEAAMKAFMVTGLTAAAASTLTAGVEARFFTGQPTFASVLPTIGREAGEEIVQEGGNQLGVNVGVQQTVDPTQALMEGVPEAGGIGAVAGGVQGGALKLGEAGVNRLRNPEGRIATALALAERARAGEALSEKDIALVRATFPNVPDEFFESSRTARDQLDLMDPRRGIEEIEADDSYTDVDSGQMQLPGLEPPATDLLGVVPQTPADIEALDADPGWDNAAFEEGGQRDFFDPQQSLLDPEEVRPTPERQLDIEEVIAEQVAAEEAAAAAAEADRLAPPMQGDLFGEPLPPPRPVETIPEPVPVPQPPAPLVSTTGEQVDIDAVIAEDVAADALPTEVQGDLFAPPPPTRPTGPRVAPAVEQNTQPGTARIERIEPTVEQTLTRVRAALTAMKAKDARAVAKDAQVIAGGKTTDVIDRLVTVREAIETLKPYQTEEQVLAAVRDGTLSKETIARFAEAVRRPGEKVSPPMYAANVSALASWGRATKALSLEPTAPVESTPNPEQAAAEQQASEQYQAVKRTLFNTQRAQLKRWWAGMTPDERRTFLQTYAVGRDLAEYSEAFLASKLAQDDVAKVPGTLLNPGLLLDRIIENPALQQETGVVLSEQMPAQEAGVPADTLEITQADLAEHWARLKPAARLKFLQQYQLGADSITAYAPAQQQQIVVENDLAKVSAAVVDPTQYLQQAQTDPALQQTLSLSGPQERAQYGNLTRAQLNDATVDVQVTVDGQPTTVKQNAMQAIEEADAQIAKCNALLKCLRGL